MIPLQRGTLDRILAFAALVLVGACSGAGEEQSATLEQVEGFAGLVAADEPRAVVLGRDVLGEGGNAADAAVAMYFAMTVTLPSRVGLGGGGVCLIYDNGDRAGEMLEFLPIATASSGVVPSGVRAMAALHARHGQSRWEPLVGGAETLARFGHAVSRAFAGDLKLAAGQIAADPELSRLFRNQAGDLPGEGERLVQSELSGVLGGIRSQGAGYLYSGSFPARFAEAATAAGQPVTTTEMRDTVPTFRPAVTVPFGYNTAYFSGPPAADGLVAAQLWRMLSDQADYGDAAPQERAHLFAEAAMRSFAERADWMTPGGGSRIDPDSLVSDARLSRVMADYDDARHRPAASLSPPPRGVPENPHGAGLVVADQWGNTVACSLTMNGLFGAFRMASGTGILLAAPPIAHYNGILSPSVAIIANNTSGDTHFAAAASGGSAAPTALVAVMLGAALEGRPLETVVGEPRIHHGGAPDVVFFEPGNDPDRLAGLRRRGHLLGEAPELGRVNALYCVEGVRDYKQGCAVVSDPRGHGLAVSVQ